MTYISPKSLTFENFLSQYRDNPPYELADGELIDIVVDIATNSYDRFCKSDRMLNIQ
jgi:hypothetical protein